MDAGVRLMSARHLPHTVAPAPEPGLGFFFYRRKGSLAPDQVRGDDACCIHRSP